MKKSIEGKIYNRIEKFGGKEYKHVGFEDEDKKFGDLLESIVPKVGMTKKVKITLEALEE
jgi:hypothetical protein